MTFTFQTQEKGEEVVTGFSVDPHSRVSFLVNDLLGDGYQNSLTLSANQPIVAERPMYFDYSGTASRHWQGGHCVMGASSLAREYYFAEGTTRPEFDEWLTLLNPNSDPITINADYQLGPGQGSPVTDSYTIQGGMRYTVFVPLAAGTPKDVSVKLSSDRDFLAERPMYFDYSGTASRHWQGGHCVMGVPSRSDTLFFAEGYTGSGFEEWLCIQNSEGTDATVEITYYTQEAGELPVRTEVIPAGSRITLLVNQHAGPDYQLSCSIRTISGPPVVAERPMYFLYGGAWDGGHDVAGYASY